MVKATSVQTQPRKTPYTQLGGKRADNIKWRMVIYIYPGIPKNKSKTGDILEFTNTVS